MDSISSSIASLSVKDLREMATKFHIQGRTKKELVHNLFTYYCDLKKHIDYRFIKQLGREGKDGRTFLVEDNQKCQFALKLFKPTKHRAQIQKEIEMQIQAATAGIAPNVVDYDLDGRYIVMEKLDMTLFEYFRKQNGHLTLAQQKSVVDLFKRLDACGVLHGDPNILNFMRKGRKWYAIDYGFAKPITDSVRSRYGDTPNYKVMTMGLIVQLKRLFAESDVGYLEGLLK